MFTFLAELIYIAMYAAIACWVGQNCARLAGLNLKGGLWFGTTLLIGMSVLIGELAVFNLIGVSFNGLLLYGPWLFWWVVWLVLKAKAGKLPCNFPHPFKLKQENMSGRMSRGETWLTTFLALVCCLAVFSLLTRQLLTPLIGTDGTTIWFIKAKAFYLNGHITLANIYPALAHLDYPVAFPLAVCTIYLMGSGFQEQLGLALPGLFMLACLALLYGYLRRRLVAWQSWGLVLCLVAMPAFLTLVNYLEALSQADFAEGVAFLLYGVFYTLWWEEENPAFLAVALLGAGLGACIKNEGISFLGLAFMAVALALVLRPGLRRDILREKGPVVVLVATIAAVGGWKIYADLHHYQNDVMSNFSFGKVLTSIPQEYLAVLGRFWDVVRNDVSYWFLGLGLVFSLVVAGAFRDKQSAVTVILVGVITGQILAYMLTYFISPFHLVWTNDTTFYRLLGQLVPLSFFVFIIGISKNSSRLTPVEIEQPTENYSQLRV